jgi:hypothetical protein
VILSPIAFLSSTYRDLPFERRFITEWLKQRGFCVVEHDCPADHDWYRWSLNRAGQCDVYLRLFTQRVGSRGPMGTGPFATNVVNAEYISAGGAALRLSYNLERPFPDADRLYSSAEQKAYEQSLAEAESDVRDSSGRSWDPVEAQGQRFLRLGTPIRSVADLLAALENDVRLSAWQFVAHRLRIWRRYYFDTTGAGWRRAIEDESMQQSSSRTFILKCLRKPLLLLALLVLLPSLLWLPLPAAAVLIAAVLIAGSIGALALAPTYLWIGTKSVVARGFFGLFTTQQSRREPLNVTWLWQWLERRCDVGAVSVRFANGRWFFVPFIRNTGELASVARQPAPEWRAADTAEFPSVPPETVEARIRAFAEQLQREDQGRQDQQ